MLDSAARSVGKLAEKIEEYVPRLILLKPFDISRRIKKTDAAKLQDEYSKLVEGLQEATGDQEDGDAFMANPRKSFNISSILFNHH